MLTKEQPKSANKLKTFGPWIKWLVKKEIQEYRANSTYIEMLCPNPKLKGAENTSIAKLERLVKATVLSEFGSRVEHSKCFNLLVNSVMYKLQKESLGENSK